MVTEQTAIGIHKSTVGVMAAGASVFFVANKSFSAGSVKAFGCLNWRRVR